MATGEGVGWGVQMQQNPPSTRDMVAGGSADGLSVRQIADLLGITTQAVYKHLKVLDILPPTVEKTGS